MIMKILEAIIGLFQSLPLILKLFKRPVETDVQAIKDQNNEDKQKAKDTGRPV